MSSILFATLAYPVAGEARERPLLGAWILVMASYLVPVLPLIPLLGYLIRVVVSSAAGEDESPPLAREFVDLLRLGLGAAVLGVAYFAVPVAILVVTLYLLVETPRVPETVVGMIAFTAGTTAVLGLFLVASYVYPLAALAYGRERRFGSAFDIRRLFRLARSREVLVGWAVAVGATALGARIGLALLAGPRYGPVLAAFCFAYGSILVAHLWGRGLARTT